MAQGLDKQMLETHPDFSRSRIEGLVKAGFVTVKAFSCHRSVEKTYLAVVRGRPRLDAGRLENLIGRHPVDRKRMASGQERRNVL